MLDNPLKNKLNFSPYKFGVSGAKPEGEQRTIKQEI